MPESKWVKAEDLELGDEIRFMQKIWDVKKEDWTGESRQIQGLIVKLNSCEATLWCIGAFPDEGLGLPSSLDVGQQPGNTR